jgi:hypothetical protein
MIMKQQTLEEAAENYSGCEEHRMDFIEGAKWQQERSYSEDEINLLHKSILMHLDDKEAEGIINQLFEQFKKK